MDFNMQTSASFRKDDLHWLQTVIRSTPNYHRNSRVGECKKGGKPTKKDISKCVYRYLAGLVQHQAILDG